MPKFYELSRAERLDALELSTETRRELDKIVLDETLASNLIENQISEIEIPLGLCFIRVDGKDYTLPMATEEPSVIAAANHGAKIAGNFQTLSNSRLMAGQIVFYDVSDGEALEKSIDSLTEAIHAAAKTAYPSIYARGGGLIDFSYSHYPGWLSLDCRFDTGEAMGANMINTMLEAIASLLREVLPDEKILFSILSNEIPDCHLALETRIPLTRIGVDLAARICLASDFAQISSTRAATHNKGIMNGVEAVALACGQDTRALSASIYASAGKQALSKWHIADQQLIGEITLSLPVSSVGGATQLLPKAKAAHELLGLPDAKALASLIAAVGLANNLAALKALVSDGIQKGHMSLQARSLALSAGATAVELNELTHQLRRTKTMNLTTAQGLLANIRKKAL